MLSEIECCRSELLLRIANVLVCTSNVLVCTFVLGFSPQISDHIFWHVISPAN